MSIYRNNTVAVHIKTALDTGNAMTEITKTKRNIQNRREIQLALSVPTNWTESKNERIYFIDDRKIIII